MEEMYFKPDNRKPWQKNRILALLVLMLLYFIDLIQIIPVRIKMFLLKITHKPDKKKT
jgi:hypothetical protein